jgi:hypothetical protein
MSDQFSKEEIDRLVRSAWTITLGNGYTHSQNYSIAEVIGGVFFEITPDIKQKRARFLYERFKIDVSAIEMASIVAFFEWAMVQKEHPSLQKAAETWLTWRKVRYEHRQELIRTGVIVETQ